MKTHSDLLLGALAFLKCVLLAASANFRSCVLEMPVVRYILNKTENKGTFHSLEDKKAVLVCRSFVLNSIMVEAREFSTGLPSGFCSVSSNCPGCANFKQCSCA